MSITPSRKDLKEIISAIILTYPELEGDTDAIAVKIKDDHFMWSFSSQIVLDTLEEIQASRPKPIVKPKELFAFDIAACVPMDISKRTLNFDSPEFSVQGIHHSQGGLGSLGVYLVFASVDELTSVSNPQQVFVLKQKAPEVYNEIFAQKLLMNFGILAPEIRILNSRELKVLIEKLAPAKVSVPNTCMEIHHENFHTSGAVVLQFFNGLELSDRRLILNKEESSFLLRNIGRIAVVDSLLNNSDRTNFVHRGDGNPGNILVNTGNLNEKGNVINVIAIDQGVIPIRDPNLLQKYLSSLRDITQKNVSKLFSNFIQPNVCGMSNLCLAQEAEEILRLSVNETFSRIKKSGKNILATTIHDIRLQWKHFDKDGTIEEFVKSTIDALPAEI